MISPPWINAATVTVPGHAFGFSFRSNGNDLRCRGNREINHRWTEGLTLAEDIEREVDGVGLELGSWVHDEFAHIHRRLQVQSTWRRIFGGDAANDRYISGRRGADDSNNAMWLVWLCRLTSAVEMDAFPGARILDRCKSAL